MNDPNRSQPAAGIRIRFVHLLVLSAFTAAQPIYDLLTRHPEFLPAHQSERTDILLLTLMLSLLLPGALALAVRSLGRVHPQLGAGAYLVLLGLLTAGLVLQLVKKLPVPDSAALVLSLLSGVGFVSAYCRFPVIRTYLTYLIPAVVLFPLLFLLDSKIRELILPEPDAEVGIASGAKAPVVMVIFDEFPLVSLLNGRREIDPNLFPNLAELAAHSYWFRNATTNNESTLLSIPVILSGTLPRQRPYPLPVFSRISQEPVLPPLRFPRTADSGERDRFESPENARAPSVPASACWRRICRSPISTFCCRRPGPRDGFRQ